MFFKRKLKIQTTAEKITPLETDVQQKKLEQPPVSIKREIIFLRTPSGKPFHAIYFDSHRTRAGSLGSSEVTSVVVSSPDGGGEEEEIRTRAVVNCAGAWSCSVAEMAGLAIPLVAMKHAYVTTERMEVR